MSLTISIDFAASIARLEEQSKKSADAVRQMADQMDSAASFARSALVGLAGAFSVSAFAGAIRGSIDLADSLGDLSKKTGASVEMLAGFRLAADQSGTSLEAIANGSKKLATSLVENRSAFQALGINTKNQTEALIQLGDVFAGMQDPVQRSALAVKVFGKSGDEMLPMLMEGSAGIRTMVERGQELSNITSQMAAQADAFNDSLAEMRLRTQGQWAIMAQQLLPVLNEVVTAFNGVAKSGGVAEAAGTGLAVVLETVVVLGAEVAYVFTSVGREIGGLVARFSALGEAGGIFSKEGRAAWTLVGQEVRADAEAARKEVDAFSERVLTARQRAREAATKSDAGGEGDKRGENLLKNLSGAGDEFAKLRQKDIDGWVKYADAVLTESERIEAVERDRIIKENERRDASDLAWTQGVAQRLAALQTAALSEAEIERGKLTAIENDLQAARDLGWLTEQAHKEMLEQAELEHQARLGNIVAQGTLARQKFTQMSARQQTQTVLQEMLALTNGVATTNRALFEVNKIAGIANAVVNTHAGVSRTLAAYPYPWNIPMAALHLVSGLAQVQAIKSAQFGSSTSAPSIGGGAAIPVTDVGSSVPFAAATPVPEQGRARQQVTLTFEGSGRYTYDEVVNGILPLINEAGDNGADITVLRS